MHGAAGAGLESARGSEVWARGTERADTPPFEAAMEASTQISIRRSCECHPGFLYANEATFKAHLKSARHLAWEQAFVNRSLRSLLGQREKEVAGLKRQIREAVRAADAHLFRRGGLYCGMCGQEASCGGCGSGPDRFVATAPLSL